MKINLTTLTATDFEELARIFYGNEQKNNVVQSVKPEPTLFGNSIKPPLLNTINKGH